MKTRYNKIKSFSQLLVLMVLLLQITSCEKIIDIELNSADPRITIEGTITPGKICNVKVSLSKSYYEENNFIPLYGAIVGLADSEGNTETLNQNADGVYVSSIIKGMEGRTYNLSVWHDGEEYTATSFLHPKVDILDIEVYEIPAFDNILPRVVFQDPAGVENYYSFQFYINEKRMKNIYVAKDEDRDGRLIKHVLRFSEEDNDDNELKVGDEVFIELRTIDKGVYDFFETWERITEVQTNPINNITGGALGYFSAYSLDTKKIIVPEK